MANLSTNEKQVLENLFQMGGGYVLNFSNRTMWEFFKNEQVDQNFIPDEHTARICWQVLMAAISQLSSR